MNFRIRHEKKTKVSDAATRFAKGQLVLLMGASGLSFCFAIMN